MNVLVVDDHPMVLAYLCGAVGKALNEAQAHTAEDLSAALTLAQQFPMDMVLLDLGLPGCGGIESLLRFRKAFPEPRVVVVSAENDQAMIRGALAAGAMGYIPKTSGPRIVVSALRLVAEGGRYIPPEALAPEPQATDGRPGRHGKAKLLPESRLTGRQHDVLVRLLKGRTIGQIAKELDIAETTAKHHALAVYAAFNVSSRADLLASAMRRGGLAAHD